MKKAFQLTRWFDRDEILGWYNWLKSRSVPCAIVRDGKTNKFCVWRGGDNKGEMWEDSFEVVEESGGFGFLLGREAVR